MKKIRWSTLSNTDVETSANRVVIEGEPKKDLKVSIVDKRGGKVIDRFVDVKTDQHKVLITPRFEWKEEANYYQDTASDCIEYTIKRADNDWEINAKEGKIIVRPGKRDKFEKARKEMHKKLFEEKFGVEKIEVKQEVDGTDMKYEILKDGNNNYKVKIYWGDKSEDQVFPWEDVEIEPNYWQIKGVDFDNLNTVIYEEEEKKSPWTTGWIIFMAVLVAIVLLLVFFWKKIWKWVKGEREQEKKVEEQLDIF